MTSGTFSNIDHSSGGAGTPDYAEQLEATNHLLAELVKAVLAVKCDVKVPAAGTDVHMELEPLVEAIQSLWWLPLPPTVALVIDIGLRIYLR